MKKKVIIVLLLVSMFMLVSCKEASETNAKDALVEYLDCYNTNDIDTFNKMSMQKGNIENLKNVIKLKVLTIEEIKGERLDNAKREYKMYGLPNDNIKIFLVKFNVDYDKEFIDNVGDKIWNFYIYQDKNKKWIIYNYGVG